MSYLPTNVKSGTGVVVGGVPFSVVPKPPPEIKWEILPLSVGDKNETH